MSSIRSDFAENKQVNSEKKQLSDAAKRAISEAEARKLIRKDDQELPREIAGRFGPEPVRYGDWEVNGLASDF
jgi:hypothetical protein